MKKTAVLLISCPDREGIVATVSTFLYKHGANIVDADQHQDVQARLFLSRIEWELENFKLNVKSFEDSFKPIAQEFQMDWKIFYAQNLPRVAVLTSKETHCLADLLFRYKEGELRCEIPIIISNHSEAKYISHFYNIPFQLISVNSENKIQIENEMLQILKNVKVDLVVLARYMQILSAGFVKQYPYKIINIHHSFLPSFIGARPYHQAYERGVKLIGATAHYVTSELDQGPVIEQDIVRVTHRDDVEDLIQKGKDVEKIVLSRAVRWHLEHRILVYGNKTVVFE